MLDGSFVQTLAVLRPEEPVSMAPIWPRSICLPSSHGEVPRGGVPCAVCALCEKLAVLHHREFGQFRRLKGRH